MPKVAYVEVDKEEAKESREEVKPQKSEPVPIPQRKKIITDEPPVESDYNDIYSSDEESDYEEETAPPPRTKPIPRRAPIKRKGKKKGMSVAELSLLGAAAAAAIYLLR